MSRTLLVVALASLTATAAVAQSQPTRPPAPPPGGHVYGPQHQMTPFQTRWRFETDAFRLQQQQQLEQHDPDRLDLAREVTALMEAGECDEARSRARAEGDRVMAVRVRQMCQSVRRD